MAAPCRYIIVHDGKACITPSVYTQVAQAMDYTYNMKGSLGEAICASLTLPINALTCYKDEIEPVFELLMCDNIHTVRLQISDVHYNKIKLSNMIKS